MHRLINLGHTEELEMVGNSLYKNGYKWAMGTAVESCGIGSEAGSRKSSSISNPLAWKMKERAKMYASIYWEASYLWIGDMTKN